MNGKDLREKLIINNTGVLRWNENKTISSSIQYPYIHSSVFGWELIKKFSIFIWEQLIESNNNLFLSGKWNYILKLEYENLFWSQATATQVPTLLFPSFVTAPMSVSASSILPWILSEVNPSKLFMLIRAIQFLFYSILGWKDILLGIFVSYAVHLLRLLCITLYNLLILCQ